MIPLCQDEKIGIIPWSPLARGRLTRPWDQKSATPRAATDEFGNKMYTRTEDADQTVVNHLTEISKSRGVPMAQIALAWLLAKPGVTSPIIGATKPHHLDDALAALDLKLTPEEITRLEQPYIPHPTLGFE